MFLDVLEAKRFPTPALKKHPAGGDAMLCNA